MSNYPKIQLEGRENEYLDTIWDSELWDISQMPDKLYLHTGNGVLVAIKPKFFVKIDHPTEHVSGTRSIFGFEKAGEGECTIDVRIGQEKELLFSTPEDFMSFRAEGKGAYKVPTWSIANTLRSNGYAIGQWGMTLWYNKGGVPTFKNSPNHRYRVWTDRDGVHADHRPTGTWGEKLYKTRKECEATLPKMQVVDFEDEVVETKPPVKRLDRDSALIWPMVYGENNDYDLDSREILDLFRTWGEEFESWWMSHDEAWICEHDYISEVEHFAEQKAADYIESIK